MQEHNYLQAFVKVIIAAARAPLQQTDWRVLVAMLREVDVPGFHKTGQLVASPSLKRLEQHTAICQHTLIESRTRLRKAGFFELVGKVGNNSQPSVYRIHAWPVQELRPTSKQVSRMRSKARKQRSAGQEPTASPHKPALILVDNPLAWPLGPAPHRR